MNDMKTCMKDQLLNHQGKIRIKFKNITRIFEPAPNFVILIKKKSVYLIQKARFVGKLKPNMTLEVLD